MASGAVGRRVATAVRESPSHGWMSRLNWPAPGARLPEQQVRGLVELEAEVRGVGEAGERREDVAEVLALVAGGVEADLDVAEGLRRDVPDGRGGRRRGGKEDEADAGHGEDRGRHEQGDAPAAGVAQT